jgi:diguanylate cyclase (GGDEF)-like protein
MLEGNFYMPEDEEQDETFVLLARLNGMLRELNEYSLELSRGRLSTQTPERSNYLAMGVKNLHARLNHLAWQLNQVAQGDYDQVVEYMGELSTGFNWMTQQLKLRKIQAEYEFKHDAFTGLLNRRSFEKEVTSAIADDPEKKGAMVCLGLDNLKHVNDTYGHETGDLYILASAELLTKIVDNGGFASRLSGNEFAIYIHGFDNADQAMDRITEILGDKNKRNSFIVDGKKMSLMSSKGVAVYADDAPSVTELIKYSTYAMYEIKKHNRGAIARFNQSLYYKKANLYQKLEALSKLIDERQIRFAFQPIVDLSDASIYGYEALMRSRLQDFASPIEILKIAETHSKLYPLEKMTYELIFEWMEENIPALGDKKIFFNTISGDFFDKSRLSHIHPDYEDILSHMVFEILESSVDEGSYMGRLSKLRNRYNLSVAIDDYGCGYSNDFRLLNLAPNILKVDRFFIRDVEKNQDKQIILSNLITFCATKEIRVLAEGVETEEELRTVKQLGFHYAQGFYLAKPAFGLQSVDRKKINSIH